MNDADFNTIICRTPIAVPKAPGPRDLADIPTVKLEALQKRYVNRMKLKQDHETMAKMQAVGYELGLRIVMGEIRKDIAALVEH